MWVPAILTKPVSPFELLSNMFIGTHNGKFHCDEVRTKFYANYQLILQVFACWMLKRLPEFANHQILR